MAVTRLGVVLERVGAAASLAGRNAEDIDLVVVTKYASDEEVSTVVAEGARTLGESRAESLARRAPAFPDVEWDFVGRLQGNKVRRVRPVTRLLHSMDRHDLVGYWLKGPGSPPPVLIQVNLAEEPTKGGVDRAGTAALVEMCLEAGVPVRGLMTVPPIPEKPGDSRRWFAELRSLRDRLSSTYPGLVELSMGMSADFEEAVEEGATLLRVGRAIFGPFPQEV